jgi:hypothetical protein
VGFAEVVEEPFAAAEEHRRDGEVQLVEQARREVLPHRRGPATQSDVGATCRGLRPFEGRPDAVGDEVEARPARPWARGRGDGG